MASAMESRIAGDSGIQIITTKEGDTALLADGVRMTPTGLRIIRLLLYDEWEAVGKKLEIIGRAIQFAVGDWLNYGEINYGETYSQAAELTGYQPHTLQNMKWVAGKIEPSRRRESLPWAIHSEVAGLAPSEQDYWLDCAEAEGWTRRQMRDALHPDVDEAFQTLECPACGHRWEAS